MLNMANLRLEFWDRKVEDKFTALKVEAYYDIIKELDIFAKKEQLKVLEKYINLWNPLNFVTTKEVEKIIEEKLKKGDKTANE